MKENIHEEYIFIKLLDNLTKPIIYWREMKNKNKKSPGRN